MDKFNEFLENKIQKEKEEFNLPKEFEEKIEDTLKQLDNNKKSKVNKKALAMVASLAFIVLIGLTAIRPTIKSSNMAKNEESNIHSRMKDSIVDQYSISESSDYGASGKSAPEYGGVLDSYGITSINFKYLSEDAKYKFIDNQDDINIIISFINSINVQEVEKQDIKEWDFLIQTNGTINHSIIFKDNIMNIDDKWYEIDKENIDLLKELYNTLQYEEKEVAYCGFN